MIFFKVNKNNKSTHIYQQIYHELKQGILEQRIPANEKLPAKRKLAQTLDVSINSVTNAYEQLIEEGYIYPMERKGYFVENITQFNHHNDTGNLKISNDLKEKELNREGWISLSHMTADISMFPFKEWVKSQNKAIKNHKEELSEISHPQGPYLVRQTIAHMIAVTRGVVCEAEQIVIGTGTQPLVRQLMQMQKNNTKIAVENPGYSRIYTLLKDMQFDVSAVPLDKKGVKVDSIESINPDFLFITPSHQFPTGIIMPISRRIELLNWAALSQNSYIIEDDYDSEFKYGTDNIPSLQSLDRNQRVIYSGTFSKTLLPSLRISYAVLPPDLLRAYRRHYEDWIQGSNSLGLFTLHYFIDSGEYAKHMKRMNHHYEIKRKNLIKELRLQFKEAIHIKDVPAGLHFLAQFKTEKSYEEIEAKARQEKLEIYTLRRFMLDDEPAETSTIELVIGFASIGNEEIAEAVDRLYRVVNFS
ncbi:PLP-dependent aminotransferase family protein [Virgibacillus sp. NKC19-3]|uniref:MocR-like transcriptional regulator GabR n=1 Tax=Virgibacillus saliphilus TaxID=2831674 RepID=UPI001C9B5ED1|nr:PLP-dependent aminotransferase family protein [Virgibacillus sp. NKC19-3]MBY7144429.1 PLP-dependent aminotransferase family protein [Virgibacillus sp. NKC19-3]